MAKYASFGKRENEKKKQARRVEKQNRKEEIQEQIGKQQRELNGYLASWKKSFNETHTLAEFNLPKMRAKSILNNRK